MYTVIKAVDKFTVFYSNVFCYVVVFASWKAARNAPGDIDLGENDCFVCSCKSVYFLSCLFPQM